MLNLFTENPFTYKHFEIQYDRLMVTLFYNSCNYMLHQTGILQIIITLDKCKDFGKK